MHSQRFQRGYVPIFLSYYKPHMKLFILDMCCALGIALVDLAFPAASRQALNELLPKNLYAAFFAVMAILLAAYALRSVMYFIVTYWGHMMGVRIEADIRRDLFSHMQDLSFSFYDKNRTGQLMSRATTDLFEITELAHHGPEDLFISAVTLIGALCMMVAIQWKLALIVFAVVPIFVGFTIIQRRRMMKASVRQKQTMAGINGQLESAISGMRTAKAFASEGQEEEKFRAANEQFKGAKRDYYQAMATYHAGLEFALPAMNVLTVAAGGLFIMRGEMDFVDLVTFTLYISTFLTPVRKLAAFVEQYGRPDAGEAEVIEAARRAEIYDDIMSMPEGFHTYVGERGVMLSGGQKQRVSIARIFLKNPPILILDEATSALDSVTEARIQSAFDELSKGRTTLIIAHRLSTIRSANRIIVVDENHILEEGSHEELLARGGEYAQLYNAQKRVV